MNKLMKLFAFTLLALGLGFGSAHAARIGNVPTAQDGQPVATSDYLGVSFSTVQFSSANVLVADGDVALVGIMFTSATNVSDFLMLRSTGGLTPGATSAGNAGGDDYTTTGEVYRIYMTSSTLSVAGTAGIIQHGFKWSPPAPMRFRSGLAAKMNTHTLNSVVILYHRLVPRKITNPYGSDE